MITLHRATADDVDWLLALLTHEDTEPFLGGQRVLDRATVAAEVDRSQSEPERFGRLIVRHGEWQDAVLFALLREDIDE